MQATHAFTLEAPASDDSVWSRLLLRGRRVGRVYGTHLDAQFAVSGVGYLLFVSFDNLFSAIESIYVVDESGSIKDEARLGHELEEGLLTDVVPEGERAVRFQFPGNQSRLVRVGKRPAWFGLKSRWLTVV